MINSIVAEEVRCLVAQLKKDLLGRHARSKNKYKDEMCRQYASYMTQKGAINALIRRGLATVNREDRISIFKDLIKEDVQSGRPTLRPKMSLEEAWALDQAPVITSKLELGPTVLSNKDIAQMAEARETLPDYLKD
jgi:hypothetical protein